MSATHTPVVARLSPLNFSGLIATERMGLAPDAYSASGIRPVQMWACGECSEVHQYEHEAAACCDPCALHFEERGRNCPICNATLSSYREAADCCLWKDIDAPTRWRIADAVEAGSTWADAMGQERKAVPV